MTVTRHTLESKSLNETKFSPGRVALIGPTLRHLYSSLEVYLASCKPSA